MKISYNWLKEYVDFSMTAEELGEALTLVGFEVEDVVRKGLDLPGVVVGKVLSKAKHPDADKLSLCTVTVGGERELPIVCGAPNVAEGQLVPVATVGAELPGGFKIRKAKIRGEVSEGMICSEAELGISEEADGIWILPEGTPLGKPLAQALGYETDYMLDISITPNRPDALSHIGIAREVAAITGNPLKLPDVAFPEGSAKTAEAVAVEIDCPAGCPRYAARLVRNIKLGPSPDWMARRLETVGMRPINNIVDITNYVMLETGQPLHAFDAERIAKHKIVVRESKPGETFTTLDEKTHELPAGTVLICDGEKPVALGGIMGGLNSEVGEETRHILLESAYFAPSSIRKSLRHLKIPSEASQRFERGVDPNGAVFAQSRAVALMIELAGGEASAGVVDNYPVEIQPKAIQLDAERINRLLGTKLSAKEMSALLTRIGLQVDGERVLAPTFRPDLLDTADIAEEVGRLYGYDNIPETKVSLLPYVNPANEFDDFMDRLRDILTGIGLQEIVTNSMIHSATWEKLSGERVYPILNPISSDMDGMRNNLTLSTLGVVRWNYNRQQKHLALFEINRVYHHPGDLNHLPREEMRLSIALTGVRESELWYSAKAPCDFYDIKGMVDYLGTKISLDKIQFIPYDNFAVESQALRVVADGKELGFLGKIRPSLLKHYDIDSPVYAAELDVSLLYELARREKRFQEIPRYPWVERDLAVMVDRGVAAEALVKAIRSAGGRYLKEVFIFDIYSGKQVDARQKSVAFRLRFQSLEKTLVEQEVNQATDNILKTLHQKFAAQLRT